MSLDRVYLQVTGVGEDTAKEIKKAWDKARKDISCVVSEMTIVKRENIVFDDYLELDKPTQNIKCLLAEFNDQEQWDVFYENIVKSNVARKHNLVFGRVKYDQLRKVL